MSKKNILSTILLPLIISAQFVVSYASATLLNFKNHVEYESYKNKLTMSDSFVIDQKSQRTVIVVHGFSDSLYYMKDITSLYAKADFNVVGVLLSGHGGNYKNLSAIKYTDWIKDLNTAVKFTQDNFPENKEIHMTGFSMGALLVLNHIKDHSSEIHSALLFAPTIKLYDNMTVQMARVVPRNVVVKKKRYGENLRYTKIVAGGVQELLSLQAHYKSKPWPVISRTKLASVLGTEDEVTDNIAAEKHLRSIDSRLYFLESGHTEMVSDINSAGSRRPETHWSLLKYIFNILIDRKENSCSKVI